MKQRLSRRQFIEKASVLSASAFVGLSILPRYLYGKSLVEINDISIVKGTDYYSNTLKAIELIGGIEHIVKSGSHVGLLINSGFDKEGAYVNPDIALAVLKLCFDAGAGRVSSLQYIDDSYWQRSNIAEKYKKELNQLEIINANNPPATFDEKNWVVHEIPNAVSLKNPEIIRELFEVDVFISIPISKHHGLTFLTCGLKNMMGVCTRKTNVGFHLDSGVRNDPEYLAQCIADINLARKPDLIVVDATKFIVNNGPSGPGDVVQLNKILAGKDIVALDTICTPYINHDPDDIISTKKAEELKLGTMDLNSLKIKEISV
ncbi:DUF362 domain-containing protein [Bacteroidota bacterium]